MKILLTGAHGQVGSDLARALPALGEVVATDRDTLDLCDADAIRRVLRAAKPEVIVNAGGYTAVDKAESEPDLAMRANAGAPAVLGEEAKRLGALLVHYSSDYIFDGKKRVPYIESDAARPLSQYGRSKLAGEREIIATACRALIVRTSWVYGPRATNFFRLIRSKAQAGEDFAMVTDQVSVPTPASFLAQQTLALVRLGATGVLHLVPSGEASRHELALEVVRVLRSRSRVRPALTSDFRAAAERPAYSVLDNTGAASALGAPLPDWRALLREALDP